MPTGLEKTLRVLQQTANDAAVPVLTSALDQTDARVRVGALRALLARRNAAGQREILRRLHEADDAWREALREKPGRLSQAMRDAVLGDDALLCRNACQAALWLREFELAAPLTTALETEKHPYRDLAGRTLLGLAELLYEELSTPRDYSNRRDPQLVRRHVLATLEKSLARFGLHRRHEVLEAFTMLAARDNAVLRGILGDPYHTAYLPLVDLLARAGHPSILRLLLSFLDDSHAPLSALHVVGRRCDPSFLRRLMIRLGPEPDENARHNLKRLDNIPWLAQPQPIIELLDEAGQLALVRMVMLSGVKRLTAYNLLECMLACGKPSGRRAATAALAEYKGADANTRVMQAAEDHDPEVQALALRQLRNRNLPGALPRLIAMLDHAEDCVRLAARESLQEFSFARFVGAYDTLDDAARTSTGALVRKADPQCAALLNEELKSPARSRRLRALKMVVDLDLVDEVEEQLLVLLQDEDHVIRAETAQVLVGSPSPAVETALRSALDDRSVAVKEAAQLHFTPPGDALRRTAPWVKGAAK